MTSRRARDSKAEATHTAAMKIIEADSVQRRIKTARLRELRLAKQAEIDAQSAKTIGSERAPSGRAYR